MIRTILSKASHARMSFMAIRTNASQPAANPNPDVLYTGVSECTRFCLNYVLTFIVFAFIKSLNLAIIVLFIALQTGSNSFTLPSAIDTFLFLDLMLMFI